MHAANFLKLCILRIFYSYAHRFAMQQCRCKFSEPMQIYNALVHMQIFWSLHAANFYSYVYQFSKHAYANFLELCKLQIFFRYACKFLLQQSICKFSGAMHICGLTICGQNGKYLKIFPAQQGILLLLLHLTKLANAKSDKEERLQTLPQANSAKILKGQCDENIV